MAETIGDLKVKLGMDDAGFVSGIQNAKQAAGGLGSVLQTAIGTAGGFIIAQGVMRAVGVAVDGAKGAMLGYNSSLEQARIGFTTLLGSAQRAGAFLQQLQDFANTSPFSMPQVEKSAQGFMAMGFSAEEVIPILTDVANAAAAMGRGQQGIDSMTLAITQMASSGILHTQDLNQMVQAGIPVWEILAEATGKNTGEVRKLTEAGQISSDVFIKAFDAYARANFGTMLAAQAKTGAGAMSTLKDVLNASVAQGTKPLYDGFVRLANMAAAFVQSTAFQSWIATITQLSAVAVQWLGQLGRSLAGVLGIDVGAMEAAVGYQAMGDAGTKAAGDTAAAMDGVKGSLTGVGDATDDTTAKLKAQATEADAHLRDLTKTGDALSDQETVLQNKIQDTGKAYDDQSQALSDRQEGLQRSIEDVTAAFDAQIGTVKDSEAGLQDQIDSTTAAFDRQISALNAAESGLQRQIEDIGAAFDRQISGIKNQESDLQSEIDSTTRAYQDQITPLQDQIDLLTKAQDLEARRRDDALKLRDIQLQEAAIAAEGDPTVRAQLTTQLELLKAQQQQHDTAQRIADVQNQIANAGPNTDVSGLQIQLATLQTQQRLYQVADNNRLAQIAGQQELVGGQEKLNSLQEQAQQTQNDIAAIPLEQKVAALTAEENARLTPLKAQLANLQQQEQSLQRQKSDQLQPMQDQLKAMQRQEQDLTAQRTAALAPLQSQLATLKDQEKSLGRQKTEQLAPMQSQLQGIQRQEQDLSRARRDALAPMQDQLTNLQRQSQEVDTQRKHWQEVKSDIEAAQQAAKDAAGNGGGIDVAPGVPRLPTQPIPTGSVGSGAGERGMAAMPIDIPIVDKIKAILQSIGDFDTKVTGVWIPALRRFWENPNSGPVKQFLDDLQQGLKDSTAQVDALFTALGNKPANPQPEADFGPQMGGTAAQTKTQNQQIVDGFVAMANGIADALNTVQTTLNSFGVWLHNAALTVNDWSETARTAVINAWHDIVGAFVDLGKTINGWSETARTAVIDAWNDITGSFAQMGKTIDGWSESARTTVINAWNDVRSTTEDKVGQLAAWLSGAWNDIAATFWRVWHGLESIVSGAWDGVKSAVQSGIDGVRGLFNGADQWLVEPGKNLIRGLFDGINQLGDWFKNAWNGWIDAHVPEVLRGALEMHSPSQVMARLGKEIPAGILVGINAGAPGLAARMANLVPLPSVPMLPNGSPFPGHVPAAGAFGGASYVAHIGDITVNASSLEEMAHLAGKVVDQRIMAGLGAKPQANVRQPGVVG